MPGLSEMARFAPHEGHVSHPMKGTFRTSRRARQERISCLQDRPRARKNVTHIVTILCVQGAPRVPSLLPIHARFSILTRPYVPIL